MKIMAGYDTEHRTDYRAKAAEDLAKIQRKAKLLDEMLDGVRNGDAIGRQDAFEELYNSIKTAQPKIQKIIKEESDDVNAVQKLLGINDYINNVVTKYDAVKSTRRPGSSTSSSAQPSRSGSPTTVISTNTATSTAGVNLIDFDDEVDIPGGQPSIFLSNSPAPGASASSSTSPTASAQPTYPSASAELLASAVSSQSPQSSQKQHLTTESILAQFGKTSISAPVPVQPVTGMPFGDLMSSSAAVPQQQPNPFAAFQQTPLASSSSSPIPSLLPQGGYTPSPAATPANLQPAVSPQSIVQPTPASPPPPQQQQQQRNGASSNLLDLEGLF